MNVIIAYLETMFSAYPQTPRLLDAKAELQTMMEDAYAGLIAEGATQNEAVGQVITDFGNLDDLAPVLGISAEIAPANGDTGQGGSGLAQPASAGSAREPAHPPVTMEEAEGFAEVQRRTRFRLGAAVALSVISPIPLIMLITAADVRELDVNAGVAMALGIVLLLLGTGAGVLIIVGISGEFAPFTRLQRGRFTRNPIVTQWADELARTHERSRITAIKIAVSLWILSPVPILIATLAQPSPQQGLWIAGSVALTLLVVAAGLLILLPAAWAHSVADTMNRAGSRDH
ncbi:hypothetical protein GCM10027416_28930 [Okibacterium endophyticum]